jgi:hypothetical protein
MDLICAKLLSIYQEYCMRNTIIKPMLVKQEASVFIRMVCLKSALEGSRQTCTAHTIKYTRIGTMQVVKNKNSFISSDISKK